MFQRRAEVNSKSAMLHPFGSCISSRGFSSAAYRYGFNGKEKETDGTADNYDFGARIYDGRLGRWLSVDPSASMFPNESPYLFVAANPTIYIDPDGKKRIITYIYKKADGSTETAVVTDDDLISKRVRVDNTLDEHDWHYEYDWYDYSQTITINYDANGNETSRSTSDVSYDKKRTRTWYDLKWYAKAWVDDGIYENYGGVSWTSKNGSGKETRKTNRTDINTEDIDDLLSLLSNGKTTYGEKGTIDYIMYALDKITASGDNLDEINEKMKKYDKKFVYRCCHNWLYDSDGNVVSKDGKVPDGKKESKKKYKCSSTCTN
jgi:RHS repeat-associated protein